MGILRATLPHWGRSWQKTREASVPQRNCSSWASSRIALRQTPPAGLSSCEDRLLRHQRQNDFRAGVLPLYGNVESEVGPAYLPDETQQ